MIWGVRCALSDTGSLVQAGALTSNLSPLRYHSFFWDRRGGEPLVVQETPMNWYENKRMGLAKWLMPTPCILICSPGWSLWLFNPLLHPRIIPFSVLLHKKNNEKITVFRVWEIDSLGPLKVVLVSFNIFGEKGASGSCCNRIKIKINNQTSSM